MIEFKIDENYPKEELITRLIEIRDKKDEILRKFNDV